MDASYVKHYDEFGYAIVRGVFSPDEVAELAHAFDRVYAEGLMLGKSFRHGNTYFNLADDANLGAIVRMVQWPSYFNKVLDRYRRDTRMLDIVAPMLGPNLKQIINQMHWKPPGAAMAEFGFHQDSRFRRPREAYRDMAASYVQTGIAVDPHGKDNGAITIYPGSHRLGEFAVREQGRIMHNAMSADDLVALGLDPAALVDVEMEPGDVGLWGLNTIHGSGPNNSAIDRRLYINGYVIAENCDRGEWTFRDGEPVALGDPVLVHYENLHADPFPHFVEAG